MSDALAMQLQLEEQSPRWLQFQLSLRNTSRAKLLVPRPAVNCLRFGNMATGKESPWKMRWLDSASWAGFFLGPGEVKEIDYRLRPCSVAAPAGDQDSEYARCCVELPPADYL